MNEYAVVIVHYRAADLLEKSVEAVRRQTVQPTQRFVVDNGEGLDPSAIVWLLAAGWQVVPHPNLGYAPAVNALRDRLGEGVEYLLVLTHDADLEENAVQQMLETARDKSVGLVGPVLRRSSTGAVFSMGGVIGRGGRTRHLTELPDGRDAGTTATVDWVDGAIMLVRRRALDEVDWLNERYFLYFEEVDLALRLARLGYSVRVASRALGWQEPGNFTAYLSYRNHLLLGKEQGLGGSVHVVLAARVARRLLADLAQRRNPQLAWTVRGVWDGIRGNDGLPPTGPWARSRARHSKKESLR